MPRVSDETLQKLQSFIDSLPAEARSKCALCNETLTHIVKRAEVETGAGTATVARVIADKLNEDAAPQDRVSDQALKQKVMRHEGVIGTKRTNNPEPKGGEEKKKAEWEECKATEAIEFAIMAISQLERIRDDDPQRLAAFERVTAWIQKHRNR